MWGGWGGHLYFPLEYYIKAMAVFFSIISAVTMFFLIKHFRPKSCYLPTVIACATLFSPAFLLDILKANLPDSLYLSFMLLSLLCFVKRKTGSAWFLCIVGACFKLMAIYLIPVYIWFYLKNFKTDSLYEKIKPFIFSFLALLICSLPNIITGGSFKDAIVTPILERSNAMMNSYSLSIWNFLPNNHKDFHLFAITLTGLTFIILFIFLKSFVRKEHYAAIEFPVLLTLSPLICYFFLPAQHEAYFASATIFAVLGAVIMLNKKFFGIAVALNALFFYIYSLIISMISKAMNTIDLLSSGRLLFQLLTLVYIAIVGSLLQEIWRNSRLYKQTTS
jgi:hypothetical protein